MHRNTLDRNHTTADIPGVAAIIAVHFIANNISMKIYRQLGHRTDGELPAGAY